MSDHESSFVSSGENPQTDAFDQIVEALVREGTPQEVMQTRPKVEAIAATAEAAAQDDTVSDRIINKLFPNGLPSSEALYKVLADIEFNVGWGVEAQKLAGILWSSVFARLTADGQRQMLEAMIRPGIHFFRSSCTADFPTTLPDTCRCAARMAAGRPEEAGKRYGFRRILGRPKKSF